MAFTTPLSLSPQESRVVLTLSERGQRRRRREQEIVTLLGATPKAADHVIESLRHKGSLDRDLGSVSSDPGGPRPQSPGLRQSSLALASRIADPYYIGFSTAAPHYGLTTQHRNVIYVVTPVGCGDGNRRGPGPDRQPIGHASFRLQPVIRARYKVISPTAKRPQSTVSTIPRWPAAWAKPPASWPRPAAGLTGPKQTVILSGLDRGALVGRFGWLVDFVKADVPPRSATPVPSGGLQPQNVARSQSGEYSTGSGGNEPRQIEAPTGWPA